MASECVYLWAVWCYIVTCIYSNSVGLYMYIGICMCVCVCVCVHAHVLVLRSTSWTREPFFRREGTMNNNYYHCSHSYYVICYL